MNPLRKLWEWWQVGPQWKAISHVVIIKHGKSYKRFTLANQWGGTRTVDIIPLAALPSKGRDK